MSNIGNKATFSRNLRYYIAKSGKDRRELCEIWGFPYSTVSEWLTGRKYPRIDRIEIMADYFGILKSDLIEEKSEYVIPENAETKDSKITINKEGEQTMGDVLRTLRTDSHLSLTEFSEEIGIPVSDLKKYEEGSQQMSIQTISTVAGYFNLTASDIAEILIGDYAPEDTAHISRAKKWYSEFGFGSFTQEETELLFKFGRFLLWQRENK